MTRQERADVTRRAILRGAAEVFDRYGFAAASLSDVTAAGGVTKGALYFHFKSKEEIAHEIVRLQHERSVTPARSLVDGDANGLESVIRLSQMLAEELMTDVMVRAGIRLTLEQGTFDTLDEDPYREWVQATEQLMKRAADEGDIRLPLDPAALARFIVAAFTGVQMLSQVFTGREDLRSRVEDMWSIILPSLVPARKLAHFRRVAAMPVGSM